MKKKKCSTCKISRLNCICPNGFTVDYNVEKFYLMEIKKMVN
jgi:hypothetical protein